MDLMKWKMSPERMAEISTSPLGSNSDTLTKIHIQDNHPAIL
jgi:hypothetical protein